MSANDSDVDFIESFLRNVDERKKSRTSVKSGIHRQSHATVLRSNRFYKITVRGTAWVAKNVRASLSEVNEQYISKNKTVITKINVGQASFTKHWNIIQ